MSGKWGRIAGILDIWGGLRVVVSDDGMDHLRANACADEMVFILPKNEILTRVPVPWEKIPYVIDAVKAHIKEWVRTRNDPSALEELPIKMYLIRSRQTDHDSGAYRDLNSVVWC